MASGVTIGGNPVLNAQKLTNEGNIISSYNLQVGSTKVKAAFDGGTGEQVWPPVDMSYITEISSIPFTGLSKMPMADGGFNDVYVDFSETYAYQNFTTQNTNAANSIEITATLHNASKLPTNIRIYVNPAIHIVVQNAANTNYVCQGITFLKPVTSGANPFNIYKARCIEFVPNGSDTISVTKSYVIRGNKSVFFGINNTVWPTGTAQMAGIDSITCAHMFVLDQNGTDIASGWQTYVWAHGINNTNEGVGNNIGQYRDEGRTISIGAQANTVLDLGLNRYYYSVSGIGTSTDCTIAKYGNCIGNTSQNGWVCEAGISALKSALYCVGNARYILYTAVVNKEQNIKIRINGVKANAAIPTMQGAGQYLNVNLHFIGSNDNIINFNPQGNAWVFESSYHSLIPHTNNPNNNLNDIYAYSKAFHIAYTSNMIPYSYYIDNHFYVPDSAYSFAYIHSPHNTDNGYLFIYDSRLPEVPVDDNYYYIGNYSYNDVLPYRLSGGISSTASSLNRFERLSQVAYIFEYDKTVPVSHMQYKPLQDFCWETHLLMPQSYVYFGNNPNSTSNETITITAYNRSRTNANTNSTNANTFPNSTNISNHGLGNAFLTAWLYYGSSPAVQVIPVNGFLIRNTSNQYPNTTNWEHMRIRRQGRWRAWTTTEDEPTNTLHLNYIPNANINQRYVTGTIMYDGQNTVNNRTLLAQLTNLTNDTFRPSASATNNSLTSVGATLTVTIPRRHYSTIEHAGFQYENIDTDNPISTYTYTTPTVTSGNGNIQTYYDWKERQVNWYNGIIPDPDFLKPMTTGNANLYVCYTYLFHKVNRSGSNGNYQYTYAAYIYQGAHQVNLHKFTPTMYTNPEYIATVRSENIKGAQFIENNFAQTTISDTQINYNIQPTSPSNITIYYSSTNNNTISLYSTSNYTVVSNTYDSVRHMCKLVLQGDPTEFTTFPADIFRGKTALKSIEIPDTVNTIGINAFRECTGLNSIYFPESVEIIEEYAFCGCTSLEIVYLPNSLRDIYDNAFDACNNITMLEFGRNRFTSRLEYIGPYAFRGLQYLHSIELPNSLASIGDYAFYNCENMSIIDFDSFDLTGAHDTYYAFSNTSLVNIGDHAFDGCNINNEISFPETLLSIGDYAFYNCSEISWLHIPDSCTTIGKYAFANSQYYPNEDLEEIVIGSGVTSIGEYAFRYCSNLMTVWVRAYNPPTLAVTTNWWGDNYYQFRYTPIGNNNDSAHIYVPSRRQSTYRNATGWRTWSSRITQNADTMNH